MNYKILRTRIKCIIWSMKKPHPIKGLTKSYDAKEKHGLVYGSK